MSRIDVTDRSTEEKMLLIRVADKDKQAFESLYRSYHQRIFQFALRMAKQSDLAEEIVGDTMFTIWEKATSFEGRSRVSTWILGIAYRHALKALEKNKRDRQFDVGDEELSRYADPSPDSNPEMLVSMLTLRSLLHRSIENLSRDHQVVVQLTAMGYDYNEISVIIGCPQNTVKTRMFHAKRQLKKLLLRSERSAQSRHQALVSSMN